MKGQTTTYSCVVNMSIAHIKGVEKGIERSVIRLSLGLGFIGHVPDRVELRARLTGDERLLAEGRHRLKGPWDYCRIS